MFGYDRTHLPRVAMIGAVAAVVAGFGLFMTAGGSADVAKMEMVPAVVADPKPEMAITEIQMTSTNANIAEPAGEAAIASVDCPAVLNAAAGPVAMINVTLDAPCYANEVATIHHEGMMFDLITDAKGHAEFVVPALKAKSVIIASFANGAGTMVETETKSLEFYDRVVLQWQGVSGLQMHAFEEQATYNEPGHVWNGAPRKSMAAAGGQGGFLIQLGDENSPTAMMAEVYTFPTSLTGQTNDVLLTVEAEITSTNCDARVAAQTLQYTPQNGLKIQDLSMKLPDCQAIGEFLILDNLLESVRLAQN